MLYNTLIYTGTVINRGFDGFAATAVEKSQLSSPQLKVQLFLLCQGQSSHRSMAAVEKAMCCLMWGEKPLAKHVENWVPLGTTDRKLQSEAPKGQKDS